MIGRYLDCCCCQQDLIGRNVVQVGHVTTVCATQNAAASGWYQRGSSSLTGQPSDRSGLADHLTYKLYMCAFQVHDHTDCLQSHMILQAAGPAGQALAGSQRCICAACFWPGCALPESCMLYTFAHWPTSGIAGWYEQHLKLMCRAAGCGPGA